VSPHDGSLGNVLPGVALTVYGRLLVRDLCCGKDGVCLRSGGLSPGRVNQTGGNRSVGISVGTVYTCDFEFGFEFNRFPPVPGQIGPVNRYRRAAV